VSGLRLAASLPGSDGLFALRIRARWEWPDQLACRQRRTPALAG